MIYTRKPRIPSEPVAALGEDTYPFDTSPPPAFDRPTGASNVIGTSPVSNQKLGNDQEMQSGADALSGVHDSDVSGGDYSREQGVGRAPGFRWPFNFHSEAFNFQSLDRWDIERTETVDLPPGISPYDAVPEVSYSPIAAMDQTTMFYENDPDQWYFQGPGPITIPDDRAPNFTEQASLW